MRLIVEYFWDVPYSASGTETFGVEYESKEKFLFDLELFIEENQNVSKYSEFKFAGITMEWCQVVIEWQGKTSIQLPAVFTVDEWFEKEIEQRNR